MLLNRALGERKELKCALCEQANTIAGEHKATGLDTALPTTDCQHQLLCRWNQDHRQGLSEQGEEAHNEVGGGGCPGPPPVPWHRHCGICLLSHVWGSEGTESGGGGLAAEAQESPPHN